MQPRSELVAKFKFGLEFILPNRARLIFGCELSNFQDIISGAVRSTHLEFLHIIHLES